MDFPEAIPGEAVEAEMITVETVILETAADTEPPFELSADELLPDEPPVEAFTMEEAKLKAVLEAIIYVTDEPLSLEQICIAVEQPRDRVIEALEQLTADYERADRGLSIREIAGGFKMTTKPEHHEEVRRFVKNLNPPLKLSLPALETLAVIAYKQPITAPEIMEIRGVQGAGVLKTLLDRKLIGTAGRKQVIGKPILYKTTREFLVQFGLKDLAELPSLKEFQEIGRFDTETSSEVPPADATLIDATLIDAPLAEITETPVGTLADVAAEVEAEVAAEIAAQPAAPLENQPEAQPEAQPENQSSDTGQNE